MNRETLKTVSAIALIGIIVVATFLYGNQQRQKQLRHDQEVAKQEKQPGHDENAETKPAPTASTPANVGGGTLPASTPETGGELGYLLPLAVIAGLYQYHRRSKFELYRAVASKK